MVTKRVSPGKRATRRTATAAPAPTDSAVMGVLESAQSMTTGAKSIDPDVRRQLVSNMNISSPSRFRQSAGHNHQEVSALRQKFGKPRPKGVICDRCWWHEPGR